jgi:hypothetical protein
MDQTIFVTLLYGIFLITGLFACLNAWLDKWGPSLAMLGMSLFSFVACLILGGSIWAFVPAVIIGTIVALMWNFRKPVVVAMTDGIEDPKAVSEFMLSEMNKTIAARKST